MTGEAQNDPKRHLKVIILCWELVTDDEFGGPFSSTQLFAMVGYGVQNIMHIYMYVLVLLPLHLGLKSPKHGRATKSVTSFLYALLALIAGCVGTLLIKTLKPSCMFSRDWIQASSLITLQVAVTS